MYTRRIDRAGWALGVGGLFAVVWYDEGMRDVGFADEGCCLSLFFV